MHISCPVILNVSDGNYVVSKNQSQFDTTTKITCVTQRTLTFNFTGNVTMPYCKFICFSSLVIESSSKKMYNI